MRQIIKHQSSYDHYESDACIVWCFDARFSALLEKFIAEKELRNIDLIKIAGGARVFATHEIEAEEDYFRGQIEKSVKLHHTRKVILRSELRNIDLIKIAGGARVFATHEIEAEEDYFRGQIEKSVKLHHTRKVIL